MVIDISVLPLQLFQAIPLADASEDPRGFGTQDRGFGRRGGRPCQGAQDDYDDDARGSRRTLDSQG